MKRLPGFVFVLMVWGAVSVGEKEKEMNPPQPHRLPLGPPKRQLGTSGSDNLSPEIAVPPIHPGKNVTGRVPPSGTGGAPAAEGCQSLGRPLRWR